MTAFAQQVHATRRLDVTEAICHLYVQIIRLGQAPVGLASCFRGRTAMKSLQRRTVLRGVLGSAIAAPALIRGARGDTPLYNLKLGYADVASSPYRKVLDGFAETVRNKTNCAVDIKVYASGELGSQNNILTGMQVGIVDFAAHTTGFIQTLFPKFAILDFPYLFADRGVAEHVL